MKNTEIKLWAKNKIKGNIWNLLIAISIAGIITGLMIPTGTNYTFIGDTPVQYRTTISIGFLFYFVQVGLVYYMIDFINDNKPNLNDLFKFKNDFGRDLGAGLLVTILVALFTLLLIVPGIIKGISYALVPYLLGDEKYKDLSIMEILKKSEEMMYGHKTDYFLLNLSFIGWYLLTPFTLFLLLIWLIPYVQTANTKFLYDIKRDYEREHGTLKDKVDEKKEEIKEAIEDKIEEKKEEASKKVKEAEKKAKEKVEDAADKVIEKVDEI